MAARARILIVDDDPRIVAALRRALVYEGYDVDTAGDGADGLRQARLAAPDLVVLDVMMPGLDGFEVARRLRAGGDVGILMLTARDSTADRVQGLDSGADDYLVKPFSYEELLARVRALLRRTTGGPRRILSHAGVELDLDTREVRRGPRAVNLTSKEFDLLEHLLQAPRRVFSRDQLLESVWGLDSSAVSNVVDVYVGYLRQKLEDGGEPRLIQTVRGVGYSFREG
ncbi:MAG: response regulator transcription factor [Candidatus Dormibacteraceae bacterium]